MRTWVAAFVSMAVANISFAGWVCDSGWDKYGHYVDDLNCRWVEGQTTQAIRGSLVDPAKVGQIESIRKGVDGSVYVKKHGQGTTEWREGFPGEWSPVRSW